MALDNCGKKLTPALVKARLIAEDVRRVENKPLFGEHVLIIYTVIRDMPIF
jgi:hypothetical protein